MIILTDAFSGFNPICIYSSAKERSHSLFVTIDKKSIVLKWD